MGSCFGCFLWVFFANVNPRCSGYVVLTLRLLATLIREQFERSGVLYG